jgi:hypothetical protein
MTTTITIPDYKYAGMYYPDYYLEAMRELQKNLPQFSTTDKDDPMMELISFIVFSFHLQSGQLDNVAMESMIETVRRRTCAAPMLRRLGWDMALATPAEVDILLQLSQVFATSSNEIIKQYSQFATKPTGSAPEAIFEYLGADVVIDRTDWLYRVYGLESTVYTADASTIINVDGTPYFTPWNHPVNNDALYISHKDILWDKIEWILNSNAVTMKGSWEWYDGSYFNCSPDSVTNNGSTLTFDLTELLGTADRSGLTVRVQLNQTGLYEDCAVFFSSATNQITTASLLGQTTVSTTVGDYEIGSLWHPLEIISSSNPDFEDDGSIIFTLPQTITDNWIKSEVNSVTAYWIRYRVVTAGTGPAFERIKIDGGSQYLSVPCSQGQSVLDELATGTGGANQEVSLSASPIIDSSWQCFVNEGGGIFEEWDKVDSFVSSNAVSKHFRVVANDDDDVVFRFGDGNLGKVPPAGVNNILMQYRVSADTNGNVGPGCISVNKCGSTNINTITNPRDAAGWRDKAGYDLDDLELEKQRATDNLRIRAACISTWDIEESAVAFVGTDRSQPVVRALAIENSFGPKTVELCVVSTNAEPLPLATLAEIYDYFNGNRTLGIRSRIIYNNELTATNYTKNIIDVVATVYVSTVTTEKRLLIENALKLKLHPLAKFAINGEYIWVYGGGISTDYIEYIIFSAVQDAWKVTLITPSSDIDLATRELPYYGTIAITLAVYVP